MRPVVRLGCCAALLLLAGAAVAQPGGGGKDGRRGGMRAGGFADPSGIVAAELAFDRLAVEKGQWTALARIVAKDAILFRPAPVLAERWLKGRRDPAVPMRWQTRQVFMACDGSAAVSTGVWVRSGGAADDADGRQGWFTNVWRRDKQGYRLILSDDGPLTVPEAERDGDDLEAMTARIATCPKRGHRGEAGAVQAPSSAAPTTVAPLDPRQPLPSSREDRTVDGSLRWRWSVAPDGMRTLEAWMATEAGEVSILSDRAGPAAR